jgi:outer membrane protein assembly factor BamB
VHITAVCPFCKTSYQVQPSLRGQPIRCPNPVCRKIFTVATDLRVSEDSSSNIRMGGVPPPGNGSFSGSVGDMIPILPAEPVEPAEPDTPAAETSKHVADVIPFMPAESAAPPPPADAPSWHEPPPVRQPGRPRSPAADAPRPSTPADAPSWHEPPPVRLPGARAARPAEPPGPVTPPSRRPPTEPMPAPLPEPDLDVLEEVSDEPQELPPGRWDAPPVRRRRSSTVMAPAEASGTITAEPAADVYVPRVSKRRAWGVMLFLVLVVAGVLGGGGWLVFQALVKSEEAQYAEAQAEYDESKFGSAAASFNALAEKFPQSHKAPTYRFMAELATLRSSVADADPAAGVDQLGRFVKEHKEKDGPLMAERAHDVGQALLRLVTAFAEQNSNPSGPEPLEVAGRIDQVRKDVEAVGPAALSPAERGQIDASLGKVRTAVGRWQKRQDVLARIRAPAESPVAAIDRARDILRVKDPDLPNLEQDPEVQSTLAQFHQAHLDSIRYEPVPRADNPAGVRPKAARGRGEDTVPSLVFDPLLPAAAPGGADDDDPIILALARGVLYALKQSNGQIKWAMRVGIDTTVLPERVPATEFSPERLLVLSADTQTLTALDADGNQVWRYRLGQASLGRPVIINEANRQRAYLATYDGWVHEIELSGGGLLGRYHLGQRLTQGGTREGKTDRLYFPADDSCVYVLDVVRHRCLNVLYSGHPSGSVRSSPMVLAPEREGAPGYLVLNQTHGLDAMRLRVFELPLQDSHAAPLALDPPPEIAGWTWFEPKQDGEKAAVLSDAGILGLFGIRQPGNRDPALFPLLQPGGLDLSPFLLPPEEGAARSGGGETRPRNRRGEAFGRAQVVQQQGDDLWVLAYGRLQQVQLRWSNATGPQAIKGWREPLVLGSPLHAAQRVEDPRTGRSTLFLVTQPLNQLTYMATAVDDADGRILWQRQLGLVCDGEPLTLTPPSGEGAPLLLASDRGGGLFALDPSHFPEKSPAMWHSDFQNIAPALDDNPRVPPRLLPGADGHSAYQIAAPGKGTHLIVRHVTWAGTGRRLRVSQREVPLAAGGGPPSVPGGTLAVVGTQLVLPMAEGIFARLPLPIPEEPSLQEGSDWRSNTAPSRSRGHVVALDEERFLITDGGRGLTCWQWPRDKVFTPLPKGHEPPGLELDNRVVAPPLVLPGKAGQPPQVIVADSAGVLTLLAVRADGALEVKGTWDLKVPVTAGPFVRRLADGSVRVGCVLDDRHLAWLDPAKKDVLWVYHAEGAAIAGRPQVIGDVLVVAHQSGLYLGLDLKTGEPVGPGYTLRGSVAPAACPIAFGAGRMLAPLSDGTMLLLSLDSLRKAND